MTKLEETVEEDKCSPPTSVTRCSAERYTVRISLKMDYTLDLGAVQVWVEKKNKIMYFLWSEAHLAGKNGCVTQNVFLHYSWLLLACMIKQPHQRKYRGLLKSFFLLGCNFMVQGSNIGYHPNFNPQSEKINPWDHITCGYTKCAFEKCKEIEDSFLHLSLFFFVHLTLCRSPLHSSLHRSWSVEQEIDPQRKQWCNRVI